MDVEKVFHMTGGIGNSSYAKNSHLQKEASDLVKHITMEAIQQVYISTTPKSLGLADLGCSSGSNSLSTIKDIIETIGLLSCHLSKPVPEFRVYLNDLPTNDFNSLFKSLPDFCRELRKEKDNNNNTSDQFSSVFIGAYPGSFYHRLFPHNSLHFVYSSYSLHWLSRVPLGLYNDMGEPINKGTIYISESSPKVISQAYLEQFKEDFYLFMRRRSEEVIVGGRMVLILLGRKGSDHIDRGNSFLWQLLARSFAILVSQGEIKQKKLDSYDVHFYAPSKEEIEDEVKREGSFGLERMEMFEIENNVKNGESYGTTVAMTVRAIQESMISDHFGDGILDSLFEKYANILDEEITKEEIKPISFVMVLKKL